MTLVDSGMSKGDIIQIKGPSVPKGLWYAYWKVEKVDGGIVTLSRPFKNQSCTEPFWKNREEVGR